MKRTFLIGLAMITGVTALAAFTGGSNGRRSEFFAGASVVDDHIRLHPSQRATPRAKPRAPRRRVVASRSTRRTTVVRRSATTSPAPTHAPVATQSSAASQLVSWINQARSNSGLRSLASNGYLASTARSHSESMAARGSLYHTSPSQLLANAQHACSCSTGGEVVGKGSSVRQVFDLFMRDSAHRAVIMKSAFRYAGAGIVYSHGWYWVTVQFAG